MDCSNDDDSAPCTKKSKVDMTDAESNTINSGKSFPTSFILHEYIVFVFFFSGLGDKWVKPVSYLSNCLLLGPAEFPLHKDMSCVILSLLIIHLDIWMHGTAVLILYSPYLGMLTFFHAYESHCPLWRRLHGDFNNSLDTLLLCGMCRVRCPVGAGTGRLFATRIFKCDETFKCFQICVRFFLHSCILSVWLLNHGLLTDGPMVNTLVSWMRGRRKG